MRSPALALLAVLSLHACSTGQSTKPMTPPTAAPTTVTPNSNADPLADATKWIAKKNWPQALAALRSIIDGKTFSNLAVSDQYRALSTAGRVATYRSRAAEAGV